MKTEWIKEEYKSIILGFIEGLPRFLKYQLITKFLISAIIFPGFGFIVQALINMRGLKAVSNNEIFKFILSPHGLIFLAIGIIILICGILVEVGGLITISAQVFFKKAESSYKELLKINLKKIPKMLELGTLLLVLYIIIIIVPLSGFGNNVSIIADFRIPNFIKSVIETNPLYTSLYFLLIAVLIFFSLRWIFCFHFLIIAGDKPSRALKKSAKLLKDNKKNFFIIFICFSLVNALIFSILNAVWMRAFLYLTGFLDLSLSIGRILMILLIITQNLILSLITLLVIPFEIYMLTVLFYKFTIQDKNFTPSSCPMVPEKIKPSLIDRILKHKKATFTLLFILIIIISVPLGLFFDDFFNTKNEIVIVGHRGGGGFDIPENSISSIKESIKHGVHFVEIDIQRTKDNFYILNHDKTFARMAGENRTAQDMTLGEIKNLDIGQNYPGYAGEKVCTLDEVLDLCKNRIGIFIELKCSSADKKMVDDVFRMVRIKKNAG
ncbi:MULTISPECIES: glycerophosphoryl diester phosphodiesterase membrane domain-containing protein [unclassified Treponema]|uniref:glycerophosphoryl diester phosphodiesterase membrane domain-containing protein n=1 Tax=unclassified Treponema TaxID=2638727 RepID=UPI0020A3E280|nr:MULTISPECIES: glycerophosphoryl diester phosphodiesterase membrane domain-containing protein [unclassified Treponema]UTC67271.1 glycerophosphoryl diester phosphodiesterase membrane domain-containing protein [Treponema sp. OMZ 789]UTC69999.1 glycerophosphoryl diester phosphodiesterase membrane domain-containing protein [Treponema sp. OMZ 790]UTC72714.1 glycerophosphoryl diester phosphodiesterase membrane domain-containing protein [Treponema sp. OMZ 791]